LNLRFAFFLTGVSTRLDVGKIHEFFRKNFAREKSRIFISVTVFDFPLILAAGEMGILSFLEMVSDKLNLQIDASSLDPNFETVVVPDTGPLTLDRAKSLVLSSLYLQGYTWIHDSTTDLYRVMRQRDARDQEIPVITDLARLPDSDLLVTYLMKIEHTPPEYIRAIYAHSWGQIAALSRMIRSVPFSSRIPLIIYPS
jgi:hypothetical protein